MAKKARAGASYKAQYTAYKAEDRARKNKLNRLRKRLERNPEDVGAKQAIDIVTKKLRFRQKPGQKGWYHPQEQELLNILRKSKDDVEITKANDKLRELRYISNKVHKQVKFKPSHEHLPNSIADELHNIGLIKDGKHRKFSESRVGSIRQG